MKLELKVVGDIQGRFVVPAYQRGYRWGDHEVRTLLNDIYENRERSYCLQPIVVKQQGENYFELIDGQQRVSSLYLIFLYMLRESLKKFKLPFEIEYESRPRSADYLKELNEDDKESNIDFHHMYSAYQSISQWFQDQDDLQLAADDLYRAFKRGVKVIWYEADEQVDSTTLFTRLNVGRIPLTNAELIKALLLATSDNADHQGQHEEARQIEIATQWDIIERELHDDAFWSFLSNQPGQRFPSRIELLFKMMAEEEPLQDPECLNHDCRKDPFYTFFWFKKKVEVDSNFWFKKKVEVDSKKSVWRQVFALYNLLREWYEDRDLYHKVGYLIASDPSDDIRELLNLVKASKTKTKSQFQKLLDTLIKKRLGLKSKEGLDIFSGLSYQEKKQCERVLLLFNVETVRTLKNSSERYPFDTHKEMSWSLEHIHAQNAIEFNKKEQWLVWLDDHKKALASLSFTDQEKDKRKNDLIKNINRLLDEVNKGNVEEDFSQVSNEILAFLSSDDIDDIHAITNLALLTGHVNSVLSNSAFQVKRLKIIERDQQGDYIPICTRRVFLKYYTSDTSTQQLHLWSRQDQQDYLDAMIHPETGVLFSYLETNVEEKG